MNDKDNTMAEVKITIEWDGNTAGLHSEPMTVHIAGKADPKKVIGAVVEAMGMANPKCEDDEFIHIQPRDDGTVEVILTDGIRETFATYSAALKYIETISADEKFWEN